MRNDSNYIRTFTGKKFYPLDPQPEDVDIIDIAHALSNICRFTGHLRKFYSVAQHSVLVSINCKKENALYGLLHDASEAYISDISSPVKHSEAMKGYVEIEKRLQAAIFAKFGITDSVESKSDVKTNDRRAFVTECRDLRSSVTDYTHIDGKTFPPYDYVIFPWSPSESECDFMDMFRELTIWNTGLNNAIRN